jgi:spectrin beta
MKVEKKNSTRRVPSFTTRRRTQSFRRPGGVESPLPSNIPPVEIRGLLDRKHELMSGGKRAAIRSWKCYYTGKKLFSNNISFNTIFYVEYT